MPARRIDVQGANSNRSVETCCSEGFHVVRNGPDSTDWVRCSVGPPHELRRIWGTSGQSCKTRRITQIISTGPDGCRGCIPLSQAVPPPPPTATEKLYFDVVLNVPLYDLDIVAHLCQLVALIAVMADTNGLLPLLTPPSPGLDINANAAPRIIAVAVVCILITIVAVAMRIWARRVSMAGLWWDDYTIILAMVGKKTVNLGSYGWLTVQAVLMGASSYASRR